MANHKHPFVVMSKFHKTEKVENKRKIREEIESHTSEFLKHRSITPVAFGVSGDRRSQRNTRSKKTGKSNG